MPGRKASRSCGAAVQHSRGDAVINHLIEPRALLRRCRGGPSDRAGTVGRQRARPAAIAGPGPVGKLEILRQFHAHERRRQVEQQRCIELPAMGGPVGVVEQAREVEREDVHGKDARVPRAQRRERLLVRVVAVRGENDERLDTALLPRAEQIVHPAVQRLAAHGGVTGKGALGGGVDAVLDGGRAQDAAGGREVVGEPLDDDCVAAQRQVRPVLFAGAHGDQQPRVARQLVAHRVGREGLEVKRSAHVLLAGAVAALAATEWLHGGSAAWVAVCAVGGAVAAALAPFARPRGRSLAAAGATLALGATLVAGWLEIRRIECCRPAEREARIARDSAALGTALQAAVSEARRLAERGRTAALLPRDGVFAMLRAAVAGEHDAPEHGVAVLAPDGAPWAWAGRHRFVPERDAGDSLRAVITPFYVTLEARRQTADRKSVV